MFCIWEFISLLAEECIKVRSGSKVLAYPDLASLRLEKALEAVVSLGKAGGDFAELNVHGAYWRHHLLGKMRALVPRVKHKAFQMDRAS